MFDLDQVKPWGTVENGKHPAAQNYLFGPGHPTDELGLYGVADGDVALDGEGGEAEGAGVDAQVLQVDHQGAPHRAPHPLQRKVDLIISKIYTKCMA